MSDSFLPYGKQSISEDDIAAVVTALKSDYLTTGPSVEQFENEMAAYCGARYAVAVANGTAALHLALLALEVGPGNTALTSALTFVASANCARMVGADVGLIDIDPETGGITPDTLKHAFAQTSADVVIPVHYAGHPVEMPAIAEVANAHECRIVEDACHALGATYDHSGKTYRVGDCAFSDMTTFSFHPVKPMTTGEGGLITTNDPELYAKLKLLRSHGIERDPDRILDTHAAHTNGLLNPWYYEMQQLGYNYRITDIQCALGLSQLQRLDEFIDHRRNLASYYRAQLDGHDDITIVEPRPGAASGWHLLAVQIDFAGLGITRADLMGQLREQGIGTQVHYIPVHQQPYYRQTPLKTDPAKLPGADAFYDRCLSLPLFFEMDEQDVVRVARAIKNILG